jgi:hypothetical protein
LLKEDFDRLAGEKTAQIDSKQEEISSLKTNLISLR